MKLSGKGLGKVCYHQSFDLSLGSYEFEPEDFTGAVVLTVEEAKAILTLVKNFVDEYRSDLSTRTIQFPNELQKRIKQAEKCDEA